MTVAEYIDYFERIVNQTISLAPYDQEVFRHYTKLNYQRFNRWMKHGNLSIELSTLLQQIDKTIEFVVITEPWCGDAAHALPFLIKMVSASDSINISIQLRDTNSEISNYTTNGSLSIPIVIARDKDNKDLFTWGPRPKACQQLRDRLVKENLDPDSIKIELQQWYNTDKGNSIQKEFTALLAKI